MLRPLDLTSAALAVAALAAAVMMLGP